jgi:crotonobetainyl-CoA:carnitine CoA-transferase CaiB-like acyl-CoA transferase
VLELGQLMAGPFAGTILAYFGADVVKVEPPGTGDPVRTWRVLDDDGTSLWWRSLGRNKRSLALDLRTESGRATVRRLAAAADVLIENFRPGTMERWGLGPEDLRKDHPALVYARVSGYGQDGPYAAKPGFAAVCEAVGGLRHVTGEPGKVPLRSNLSLGDTLAAFHCALGVLLALLHRERARGRPGQVVDVSLMESVFGVLESAVPECDRKGVVRGPSGTTITGVVPTNAYPCADGRHVVIGANGDSIFRRLMAAIGRGDLAADPALAGNAGRVPRAAEIDAAVAAWTRTRASRDVLAAMDAAAVPAGPIHSVADLLADPHVKARGMVEHVPVGGRPLALPAVFPRLSATPGRTEWAGPALDEHAAEVRRDWLGERAPRPSARSLARARARTDRRAGRGRGSRGPGSSSRPRGS